MSCRIHDKWLNGWLDGWVFVNKLRGFGFSLVAVTYNLHLLKLMFGFDFQVKSGCMLIYKTSKMFNKISYATTWNKMNGKYSEKIGTQCYINSTLENVVLKSIEQLAHWKVLLETYDTRCLLKEYLDRTGQLTKVLDTIYLALIGFVVS